MSTSTAHIHSALYSGVIRHRRFQPRKRFFTHHVHYFYLDLDEIPRLFRIPYFFSYEKPALFSFRRRYFLGNPKQPLAESVRSLVQEKLGFTPQGPIRMLAQISYFGFCFNPVVFYYCFNESKKDQIDAIVAEITNTPWNERHAYVFRPDSSAQGGSRFEFKKEFHVSPFLGMNYDYKWFFSTPESSLVVHMENHLQEKSSLDFDASLTLKRTAWSSGAVIKTLLTQPFMTMKTLSLIYLHAAILWLRRFQFFSHPRLSSQEKHR